jgi:hypothetical protein
MAFTFALYLFPYFHTSEEQDALPNNLIALAKLLITCFETQSDRAFSSFR